MDRALSTSGGHPKRIAEEGSFGIDESSNEVEGSCEIES